METWEAKVDNVEEQLGYEMSEVDKIQALLQMTPGPLRCEMLEEQGKGLYQDYDSLRDEIFHRVIDIEDSGGKKVMVVGAPDGNGDLGYPEGPA